MKQAALPEPARKRVFAARQELSIAPGCRYSQTRKRSDGFSVFPPVTGPACCIWWHASLRQHHLSVQLAKVSTLGERVEDTFLLQGSELQNNARQIQIETELLQALSE